MIQSLSDKLLEIFAWLEWAGQPFKKVLDYHTIENKTGYPYMTFEPVDFAGEVADTCTNERTYTFQVLIFQEIGEWVDARKEAKEIITKAVDRIIGIMDKNYTLDGLCTRANPVWWTIRPFVIDSGKALVCEVQINITTLENIYL